MAQSLPTARQGLGEPQQKGARVLAPRINPPHAQKTLQSGLNSPDRLIDPAADRRELQPLIPDVAVERNLVAPRAPLAFAGCKIGEIRLVAASAAIREFRAVAAK